MSFFNEEHILNAKELAVRKCKATVQKSGRLGFSSAAAELMQLHPSCALLVSDCQDGNLAVVVLHEKSDTRGFPIRKSVNYYTVDLKMFFDRSGLDYRQNKNTIIFDIVKLPETYQGHFVYKLSKRIKQRRIDKTPADVDMKEDMNDHIE